MVGAAVPITGQMRTRPYHRAEPDYFASAAVIAATGFKRTPETVSNISSAAEAPIAPTQANSSAFEKNRLRSALHLNSA
jgi:hypothetical protein